MPQCGNLDGQLGHLALVVKVAHYISQLMQAKHGIRSIMGFQKEN